MTSQPRETVISILIIFFLSTVSLITTIGNIVVLLVFHSNKKLRTVNDYFIMNMAIADFLVGIFCIPFYIPFSVTQLWPFGRLFCKIWVTIDDVATMASVINIVAISVNRYWSIGYPLSYRKYMKQNLVYCVMFAVWFISFLNFAPGIWLIGFFKKSETNATDCSGDYNNSFVYMLFAQFNYFIWPFIVLCVLNILIMLNIWRRNRKMIRFQSYNLTRMKRHSPSFEKSKSAKKLHRTRCSVQYQMCSNNFQAFHEQMKPSLHYPETTTNVTGFAENYSTINQDNLQVNKTLNHLNTSILCETTIDCDFSRNIEIMKSKSIQMKRNSVKYCQDSRINRDRRAARSLFILVIVFLIFLFPYVICAIMMTASIQISKTIFEISFWLLWFNSTLNPFLYPFIQRKYRHAYIILFQSCFKHFHSK